MKSDLIRCLKEYGRLPKTDLSECYDEFSQSLEKKALKSQVNRRVTNEEWELSYREISDSINQNLDLLTKLSHLKSEVKHLNKFLNDK